MGRPLSRDAKQRRARFLCALAQTGDPVLARKQARIDPDRALRIACEADFLDVVQAIREGLTDVVTVELEASEAQAA
jgi:hypothetical protein